MRKTTRVSRTLELTRRDFCAAAAASVAAGPLGVFDFGHRSNAMTVVAQQTAIDKTSSDETAIRPFTVSFPDEKLTPKLVHYNKLDKGGHFAAWEQPQCSLKKSAPPFDRCASRAQPSR